MRFGLDRQVTNRLFWIVGIVLIASWVVAVVFTPYLGVKLLLDLKKIEGCHAAMYDTPRYRLVAGHLGSGGEECRRWDIAVASASALPLPDSAY